MSSSYNGRLADGSVRQQNSLNMDISESINVPSALASTARAPPEVGHYKPFATNSVNSTSSEISNTTATTMTRQHQQHEQQQQHHPRHLSQDDEDTSSAFWTPYQPLEQQLGTSTTPVVGNRAKARQAKESASTNNSFPKPITVNVGDSQLQHPLSVKSGRSSSPDLSIDEPAVNLPTTAQQRHKKGSGGGSGEVCFRSTMKGSTQVGSISRVVYPTAPPTSSIPLAATAPTGVYTNNNTTTTGGSSHDRTHGSTEDGGGSSATTTTNEISTTSAAAAQNERMFVSHKGSAAVNTSNMSISTPLSKPMPTVNGAFGHRTSGVVGGSRPPSSSTAMATSGYQAALASFSSLPIRSPDTSLGLHDNNNNAARRPTTGPGELYLPDLKLDGSGNQTVGSGGGVRSPTDASAPIPNGTQQHIHSPGSTLNNSQKAPPSTTAPPSTSSRNGSNEPVASVVPIVSSPTKPPPHQPSTTAATVPTTSTPPPPPSEPALGIMDRVVDAVSMAAGMVGTIGGVLEGVSSGIWENIAPAFTEASYVSAISTVCFLLTTIVLLWVHSMSLVMQAETQSVVQISHAYHMEELDNFVEEGVMVAREIAEWGRYCSDIEKQQSTTTAPTTKETSTTIPPLQTLNSSQEGEHIATRYNNKTSPIPPPPPNHSCKEVLVTLRDEQHRLAHALVNALRYPLGTDSFTDATDRFQHESSTSSSSSSNGNTNNNHMNRASLLVHGGVDTNSLSKSEMSRLNQYLSDSMSTFIVALGEGIDGVMQVGRDSIKDPLLFPVDNNNNEGGVSSIGDIKVGRANSNNQLSISGSEVEDWVVSFWGASSLLQQQSTSSPSLSPADMVLNVLPECAFVDELFRHTLRGCISNETISSHSVRRSTNSKWSILSYFLPSIFLKSSNTINGDTSSTPSLSKMQALLDAPLGGSNNGGGGGRKTSLAGEEDDEGINSCPSDISGVVGLHDYTACLSSIASFASLSPFEKRISVSMAFDSITTTTPTSTRTDALYQRRQKTRNYPHRLNMKPTPSSSTTGNGNEDVGGSTMSSVVVDPTVRVLLDLFNDAAVEYQGYDSLVKLVQEYSHNISKPVTPIPSQRRPGSSSSSPKSAPTRKKNVHPSAPSSPPRGKQSTPHQDTATTSATDTAASHPVTVQFILPDQTNWAGPLSLLCSLIVIWYLYTS